MGGGVASGAAPAQETAHAPEQATGILLTTALQENVESAGHRAVRDAVEAEGCKRVEIITTVLWAKSEQCTCAGTRVAHV
jgi:hypothetical protein